MKLCLISLLAIAANHATAFQTGVPPDVNNAGIKDAIDQVKRKAPTNIDITPLLMDDTRHVSEITTTCTKASALKGPINSETLRIKNKFDPTKPIALPLTESINTNLFVPPARNTRPRKIFGLDENPSEYWFDNRIHTFGNTGFYGGLHAACAPFATKMIDDKAYAGVDIRKQLAKELRQKVNKSKALVLDMCCGVGMSTRALGAGFKDADLVVGFDTSPEMISMARWISRHDDAIKKTSNNLVQFWKSKQVLATYLPDFISIVEEVKNTLSVSITESTTLFARGNAERINLPSASFDLVTIMYAFHEIPHAARYRILRESRRLLKEGGTLAIVDISPEYTPTDMMLAGEPYVLEYQKNICDQLGRAKGFANFQFRSVIPGHVNMWTLTRERKNKTFTAFQ